MGRKIKPGDIYSFQLPNGEYVFIRVYRDAAIAIYKQRRNSPDDLPDKDEYDFFLCVYRHVYRNWHYVTNHPFQTEEDSWPPPFCWVDQITGEGSLYHHGKRQPCTYDECKNLEPLAIWGEGALIDRLMGNPKWQNAMKKPVPKDQLDSEKL